MTMNYLEYELQNGFIHNWLVVGPLETPVKGTEDGDEHQRKVQIANEMHNDTLLIKEQPVDRAFITLNDAEVRWRYVRCLDDHFVDLSTFHHEWHYLQAWAYTRLSLVDETAVNFTLTTNGPADVWINGAHAHRQAYFSHQDPVSVPFTAQLQEGDNEVVVRMEEVAARECPYVMALQVAGVEEEDVVVKVASSTERTARHQMFEQCFEQAYLDKGVYFKGRHITMRWSDELTNRFNYTYHLQDQGTKIFVSGDQLASAGHSVDVGHDYRIWQGPYRLVIKPRGEEYYESDLRYQWEMPVYVLDTEYAAEPYGSFQERLKEALDYAATQEKDLYGQIAAMELGAWDKVKVDVILEAMARVNRRGDCSDFDMVGLLGMIARYMNKEEFPSELKAPLIEAAVNFKYWHDEPGVDAMCYTTENHSILFHTCEILAGQLFPYETFSNNGESGSWHKEKGERLALAWLQKRAGSGFWEWDSNCYFDEDILALSHLLMAENEDVLELAAMVIDKMLFTMAVNSFKGVFGSTHGRTYASQTLTPQLESTSGISRLMFGMGVFNASLRGLVGIACSEYEFPLMIADIAADLPEEMWNRERHVIDDAGNEINKVTYKTPDYMLSSVQDYRPGDKGYQQHIWQATFDQDAVVFVTHPACVSENGAHRPGFWTGNYVLPRVAQVKDVLIALHKLPEDDWLGFTHAYLPGSVFDEIRLEDKWVFAQKGGGYIALYASTGLELVRRGTAAFKELRAYGKETVWICHMGRQAVDGSFEDFQDSILNMQLEVHGLEVRLRSLRGETLAIGWEGPMTLDGEEYPLAGYRHYENPYSVTDLHASEMDIQFGGLIMRLAFS
ncbi:MAG: hypothetical protein P1S60_01405 [Anaerolineae bacterium]|nr:hypothetical protein [Anaerolineae bacterium]